MKKENQKPVALFDIDKTIYEGISLFPLAKNQTEQGILSDNVLEEFYYLEHLYKEGSLGYEAFVDGLLNTWAQGLQGVLYATVVEQATLFFNNNKYNFFPEMLSIVNYLANTHNIFLVTGEPQFLAEAVGITIGVTNLISSVYDLDSDSRFTGGVSKSLTYREGKESEISQLFEMYDKKGSMAFGDSEGDIGMLKSVEKPYCINPTPGLLEVAKANLWTYGTPKEIKSIIVPNVSN